MGTAIDESWKIILGPGSIHDRLQRDPRIEVDPEIYAASLIYDDVGRDLMASVIREYADIAQEYGMPHLATTATWRANSTRVAASRCAGMPVNRDAATFVLEIRDSYGNGAAPIVMNGLIGPKGDAYKSEEAPPRDEARRFHEKQIAELADTGLDGIDAKTLPALDEALGIADLMAESGKPYMLSFVVRPDGTILDGTPLDEVINRIDDSVKRAPDHYMVNCVHARNFAKAFRKLRESNSNAAARIIGLEANTSAKRPEELDGLEKVETQPPDDFGREVWGLHRSCGARYLAGCCGSGTEHIKALAGYAAGGQVSA